MGQHFSDSYLEHNARRIVELEEQITPEGGDVAIRVFSHSKRKGETEATIAERRIIRKLTKEIRTLCDDDPEKVHRVLFGARVALEHQLQRPLNDFKVVPRANK